MSEKSDSYLERLLLKPFLGLLPSWDIPSALAHHHLEWKGKRSKIYWQCLISFCLVAPIPFSYFLYLFNQVWKVRLHSHWSLASLPSYKLSNSVTQIWHPSQLLIPSVLAYSSATCPKAKCQSNPKQCFCFWWNVGFLTGLAVSL